MTLSDRAASPDQATPRGPDDVARPRWFGRLPARVVLFLSLALLPLGLLALMQTRDLTREVGERTELALLGRAELAMQKDTQLLERALGAAEALNALMRVVRNDTESCGDYLRSYLSNTSRYLSVGFLPVDGPIRCASDGFINPLAESALIEDLIANPRQMISPITGLNGNTTVAVIHPMIDDDALIGFTVVVLPRVVFDRQEPSGGSQPPLAVITFNTKGEVVHAAPDPDKAMALMPAFLDLSSLLGLPPGSFVGDSQAGKKQLYTFVDLVPGAARAIAVWPMRERTLGAAEIWVTTLVFPLLMWVASIAVATFAVHRLVVRHVQKLGRKMRRFAIDRKLPRLNTKPNLPIELQELEFSFHNMAHALLADEAHMEDNLREKNILLKEVHHRVKNNLQMISSIMNMKIRRARSDETRSAIARLQERVLGLATVHRNLYQSENLNQTNAGALLREVFNQVLSHTIGSGHKIVTTLDLDQVIMFPDQAVPFSLMGNEIATNALTHLGHAKGERPWVTMRLKRLDNTQVELSCANSVGPVPVADAPEMETSGLGTQLIRAFALQLGAQMETEETETTYTVTVRFSVEEFRPDALDY